MLSTVATEVSLLFHVTFLFDAFSGFVVAIRLAVSPTFKLASGLSIVIPIMLINTFTSKLQLVKSNALDEYIL
ncbi:hypothetical protein D3C76_1613000 [compost metagenome]